MKNIYKNALSLTYLISIVGCGSGGSGGQNSSMRSAAGNVRKIELARSCSAADINDNGEVLVACRANGEIPKLTFEILGQDDSRKEIYALENADDYTVRGFGADGAVFAAIYGNIFDKNLEFTTSHFKIKDGTATNLNFGPDSFVTFVSPNGRFFDIDERSSSEVAYFDNGIRKSIASVPGGMEVGSPLSINNSGDAVGIAYLGSEGTAFTTVSAYKVVDGKFDLLSFANRPELNSTIARSINSNRDILLELDSGKAETQPLNPEGDGPTSVGITTLAILHSNGELESVDSGYPELPAFAQRITDSGTVLGQIYNYKENDYAYFISGKDRQPVLVGNLVPLVEAEKILNVTINNNDQLLVNTVIERTDPSEPSIVNTTYLAYVVN